MHGLNNSTLLICIYHNKYLPLQACYASLNIHAGNRQTHLTNEKDTDNNTLAFDAVSPERTSGDIRRSAADQASAQFVRCLMVSCNTNGKHIAFNSKCSINTYACDIVSGDVYIILIIPFTVFYSPKYFLVLNHL